MIAALGRLVGGRRRRFGLVALTVLAAVAILGAARSHHTLLYYRTPSEVAAHPPAHAQTFRLAGLVLAGSVRPLPGGVTFRLTDGVSTVQVDNSGDPPSMFREGQGAVVQGRFGGDGIFHSNQVLVRHSDTYQPPQVAGQS